MGIFAIGVASPAWAAPSTADATERGWWNSTGEHVGNQNYCVGRNCSPMDDGYRAFFVFDLTSYAAQVSTLGVAEATVVITNPGGAGDPRPVTLHHVSTPIGELDVDDPGSPAGKAIYKDLGSGKVYGSVTPATVDTDPVAVDLNAEGRLAVTKKLGAMLAIGGELTGGTTFDDLFTSSGPVPVSGVQIHFYFGPKTSLSLEAPNKAQAGARVRVRGTLSSADLTCVDGMDLEISVGSRQLSRTTPADGSYSFRAKITRRTKIRVFNPGDTGRAYCGGSEASTIIRLD